MVLKYTLTYQLTLNWNFNNSLKGIYLYTFIIRFNCLCKKYALKILVVRLTKIYLKYTLNKNIKYYLIRKVENI